MPDSFTGVLKFFNAKFKSTKERVEFLDVNGPLDDLTVANFEQLSAWLMVDVSSSDAECKAAWSSLYSFIDKSVDQLKILSSVGVAEKDAVADFLTEVLRVCNFAKHDSNIIASIFTMMTTCGITIVGDVDACKKMATFKELGYLKASHQVKVSIS